MSADADDLEPSWTTAPEHATEVLDALGVDDDRVRERALELADEYGAELGRAPTSVGAAAVYFACGENGWPVTQAEVAEVARPVEATVGVAYRALCEQEFPDATAEQDGESLRAGASKELEKLARWCR